MCEKHVVTTDVALRREALQLVDRIVETQSDLEHTEQVTPYYLLETAAAQTIERPARTEALPKRHAP